MADVALSGAEFAHMKVCSVPREYTGHTGAAAQAADSTGRGWRGGIAFIIFCMSPGRECLTDLISIFQNTSG